MVFALFHEWWKTHTIHMLWIGAINLYDPLKRSRRSIDFYMEICFEIHILLAIAIAYHMQYSFECAQWWLKSNIKRNLFRCNFVDDEVNLLAFWKRNIFMHHTRIADFLFKFFIFCWVFPYFDIIFLILWKNIKKRSKWSNLKKMVILKKKLRIASRHDNRCVHTKPTKLIEMQVASISIAYKEQRSRIAISIYAKGFHFKLPDNQIRHHDFNSCEFVWIKKF